MDTLQVQARLKELGFDPGALDGIPGRATIAAVKKFQTARALPADGIVGAKTAAALFPVKPGAPAATVTTPRPAVAGAPPWLELARAKTGLTEKRDNSILRRFLFSDGHTLGDPAKLPWCGDFVETCIAVTLPDEKLPANPYYATNWSTFGVQTKPALGAIMVFKRPGGGHVAFYEGEDARNYIVRGGNQSNSISKVPIDKARCIAVRWPKTYPLPTGGTVIVGDGTSGPVSTNEA